MFISMIKGMPLDAHGDMTAHFFDYFNWFSIVGGIALTLLCYLHGLNYITIKTKGVISDRAQNYAQALYWVLYVGEVVFALLLIFLPVLGNYIGRDFDFISRLLAFAVQKMFVFFAGFFGLTQGDGVMSVGFFQLLVILLIILVLFGRGKLPALAEDLGKSVSSFKKGLSEDKEKEAEPEAKQNDTDPSKDA